MKYSITLFVALVVFCKVHYAQDSLRKSTLSLRIGPNYIMNKDEFQSPYTYKGTGLSVTGAYLASGTKGEHDLQLNYTGGKFKSSVSPQADNQLISVRYDYLFRIKPANNSKYHTSLGLGVHTFLSSTNYLPKEALSKNYLSGSANLMLSGSTVYNISEKSKIKLRMSLAVLGVVYRPDVEINGETFTEIAPIGKNNLFDARLEYSYRLNARLGLVVAYQYNYFNVSQPQPLTIMQNGLFVGLKYGL